MDTEEKGTSRNATPRRVTGHETNPANGSITITADEPTHGNASDTYYAWARGSGKRLAYIEFQNGPVAVDGNGVNGVTNEVLLAIVADRLGGYQSGDYKCRENAIALTHIEDALHWLHHRTRERQARGVEGTHAI